MNESLRNRQGARQLGLLFFSFPTKYQEIISHSEVSLLVIAVVHQVTVLVLLYFEHIGRIVQGQNTSGKKPHKRNLKHKNNLPDHLPIYNRSKNHKT